MTERAAAPTAYPLAWPAGWPRSRAHRLASFKVNREKAIRELGYEIDRLGGTYPLISSNVPTRIDGGMRADKGEPIDRGVAVYFERKGKQQVFACDTFTTVKDNIRAVGLAIAALRALERYGVSDMLERALTSFEALPPPGSWRTALGFSETGLRPNFAEVATRYRELVKTHHPDRGGDPAQFRRLTEAYEAARKEFA